MIVVAGPAGSGKSTTFPVKDAGVDFFNIDDRAAALNHGSYRNIAAELRSRAIEECEVFIAEHIQDGRSFAVETTLRTEITFEQAKLARARGFALQMRYVAIDNPETNVKRIANRAERGGHAATPARIREIYAASLKNFTRAIREFDRVRAYDNSRWAERPRFVLESRDGKVQYITDVPPSWLENALSELEDIPERPPGLKKGDDRVDG